MDFTLTTLGSCQLTDQQGRVVHAPLLALHILAYLCHAGAMVPRRDLARLLWPANPDAAATNLRSTLRRLGKASGNGPPIVISDGALLGIDRQVLVCDLDVMPNELPLARLSRACDAVAKQFLPADAGGTGAFAGWVRHVRAALVRDLRRQLADLGHGEPATEFRPDLRRAAILLLESDPHDDEARRFLSLDQTIGRLDVETATGALPPARIAAQARIPEAADDTAKTAMHGATPPASGMWTPPRVALLPPEGVNSAQKAGSVANALIEDLTIDLCTSRAVSVVAPYTSEQIRASTDKAELLERHRVIYALDTKRSGDCLFAQLIFMPTDEVVWATRFQLDPRSVSEQRIEMADAIKGSIVQLVRVQAHLGDHFTEKPEAYFAYLRGMQSLSDLTLPAVRKARRHFREALEHERDFAMALSGISRTLSLEWILTARGDKDLLVQAENLAQRALQGAPALAGAYKELGVSRLYLGKIDESVDALSHAEQLSPHYADVLFSHADSLVHASQPDAALSKIMTAMELNPLSPDKYLWIAAGASFFLGAYSQALEYIERMRVSGPADRLAAACWGMLGDQARARRCRSRVLKENPEFDFERWLAMIPIKAEWQRELYREGLSKAGF